MEINDIKDVDRLADLISRYLLNDLSDEERSELAQWAAASAENADVVESVLNEAVLEKEGSIYRKTNTAAALQVAKREIDFASTAGRPIKRLWLRAAAAAILFVLAGSVAYFIFQQRGQHMGRSQYSIADVQPGGSKATLTLSNGHVLSLSDTQRGVVLNKDSVKYADGTAIVPAANTGGMNVIDVPPGGTYEIVLFDGTKVWLNAGTRMEFMDGSTSTSNRSVTLSGEAYFEVKADPSHPFIVHTNRQQVQVLGTHFNINAYANEPTVKTTLLEGKVRIVASGKNETVLQPGEQSVLSQTGKMDVRKADAEEVLAWKNGIFLFNDEPLESIMRKIARWYDVEIIYEGAVDRRQTFGGGVSRYENLSMVLSKLEQTEGIHFKIENKKVIVSE